MAREANSTELTDLNKEIGHLKPLVAEMALKNRVLKISMDGTDSEKFGI